MASEPDDGGGLMAGVQRLMATFVALLHNRLELLALEVEEEKQRLLRTLAWGAAALLLGLLSLVFLALFVTVLLWDSHRLWALGGVCASFVLAAVGAAWQVKRLARAPGGAVASSLDELLDDYAALTGQAVDCGPGAGAGR